MGSQGVGSWSVKFFGNHWYFFVIFRPNVFDYLPCVGVFLPCVGVFLPCVGVFLPCVGVFLPCVGVFLFIFLSPTFHLFFPPIKSKLNGLLAPCELNSNIFIG